MIFFFLIFFFVFLHHETNNGQTHYFIESSVDAKMTGLFSLPVIKFYSNLGLIYFNSFTNFSLFPSLFIVKTSLEVMWLLLVKHMSGASELGHGSYMTFAAYTHTQTHTQSLQCS